MRPETATRAHHAPHEDHEDDDSIFYAMAVEDLVEEFPAAETTIRMMAEREVDTPKIRNTVLKQYGPAARLVEDDDDDAWETSLVFETNYDDPGASGRSDGLGEIMDRFFGLG